MKKKLLIAGGSGLIGTALKELATKHGWEVMILSREPGPEKIVWNPEAKSISLTEAMSFDAVINLAGASIADGKWTEARKKEIVDSRVNAAATLEKYLHKGLLKTQTYVGASAIGIYGDRGSAPLDETSPILAQDEWMVNTVLQWEKAHAAIKALGIRTVITRIGIVLSVKGGALPEIIRTAPFGFLGYFGDGHQIWPWIHIDDVAAIILHAIADDKMHGTYLAVAPSPASNKEIVKAASQAYSPHRLVIPVPVLGLKLLLGEMHHMLMESCNAHPVRLNKENFSFRFNKIEEAMEDLIRK
jgi:uncharacterized protein (TIGR01777 family)